MKSVENSSDGRSDIENELAGVGPKGAVTGANEICSPCSVQEGSQ